MDHKTFMEIAFLVSQQSKCVSWKVGALIVKDGRIISTGYNGTPTGMPNCCDVAHEHNWVTDQSQLKIKCRESHSKWSSHNEIHAEINAILYAAKNGLAIDGSTMYVTISSCPDCAKAIAQSGIKHVVYSETYDKSSNEWIKFLQSAGIEVSKIEFKDLKLINRNEIKINCLEK